MFDNLKISKLGYYVYALINPINNKPFYIVKGKDNRVFSHKKEEIKLIIEKGLDCIILI